MLPVMASGEGSEQQRAHSGTNEQRQAREEQLSCPKCGSTDVRRSHNSGFLTALLRAFGRWPLRCRSCRARFYHSSPPEDS